MVARGRPGSRGPSGCSRWGGAAGVFWWHSRHVPHVAAGVALVAVVGRIPERRDPYAALLVTLRTRDPDEANRHWSRSLASNRWPCNRLKTLRLLEIIGPSFQVLSRSVLTARAP